MEVLTSEEIGQFTSLLNTHANIVRRIISDFSASPRTSRDPNGYEEVSIQVRFTYPHRTFSDGDQIEVSVELANPGNTPVQLARIEDAVPLGFELLKNPQGLHYSDKSLDLKGAILNPLKTLSIRLNLRAVKQGLFTLAPCIIYLDDRGNHRTEEAEQTEIIVSPIMKFLVASFEEDYTQKKIPPEDAGWRTLMDIVEAQNISRSQVYGDPRRRHTFAKPLDILIEEGLVESRVFSGERGRGGRVVRVRVNYLKERARKLLKISSIPT